MFLSIPFRIYFKNIYEIVDSCCCCFDYGLEDNTNNIKKSDNKKIITKEPTQEEKEPTQEEKECAELESTFDFI
jgi:hypothetical protein